MMSEDQNQEIQDMRASRIMLEEFFDRHEYPEDIVKSSFYTIDRIHIYKTSSEISRFLIEIQFRDWKRADFAYKLLIRLFYDIDDDEIGRKMTIFRKGKSVFVRKFLF